MLLGENNKAFNGIHLNVKDDLHKEKFHKSRHRLVLDRKPLSVWQNAKRERTTLSLVCFLYLPSYLLKVVYLLQSQRKWMHWLNMCMRICVHVPTLLVKTACLLSSWSLSTRVCESRSFRRLFSSSTVFSPAAALETRSRSQEKSGYTVHAYSILSAAMLGNLVYLKAHRQGFGWWSAVWGQELVWKRNPHHHFVQWGPSLLCCCLGWAGSPLVSVTPLTRQNYTDISIKEQTSF